MSGSDSRFAGCTPALLLAGETIAYAAEAGLACYEFGAAPLRVAAFWRPERRRHVTLRVYPFSGRGFAALLADAAVAVWHRLAASRWLRQLSRRARPVFARRVEA
jgi:hypothetical protein